LGSMNDFMGYLVLEPPQVRSGASASPSA
jgi:hypothetical protein